MEDEYEQVALDAISSSNNHTAKGVLSPHGKVAVGINSQFTRVEEAGLERPGSTGLIRGLTARFRQLMQYRGGHQCRDNSHEYEHRK